MFGKRSTAQASSAIGLESGITKSGYLVKRAKKSQANWRKRYFVLNGNTLTYYKDHRSTAVAKGDILLTADATIEEVDDFQHPYTFDVTTPFVSLRLAAANDQERQEWKIAIENTVIQVAHSLRGYLLKKGGIGNTWAKRFFILHRDSITYHEDHEHTSKISGMVKFDADTAVEVENESRTITIRGSDGRRLVIQVPQLPDMPDVDDFEAWVQGINEIMDKTRASDLAQRSGPKSIGAEAIKRGYLKSRPKKGGDVWPDQYFVLTPAGLFCMEDENSVEPLDTFIITPSCSVFETNLKPHAFELVTAQKVLHVQSTSDAETSQWIVALRQVITNSKTDEEDPLLRAAMQKAQNDYFYTVTFKEKKPLGVVLERSGEWAIVKLSNLEETGVSIGSALNSVNGDSVILRPYMETIRMLTGWKPPLTLGFRKAPEKRGWLTKQARARRAKIRNWKPRYFVLAEGRLTYYDSDGPDAVMKGEVQLMGSAVSLVSYAETGQYFCFRVVAGITSLVMQGLTVDDMMDWASTLYHAIAIANGGAYLLEMERNRIASEENVRRQEELQRQADEERRRKQAEAKQAAEAAEEAEAAKLREALAEARKKEQEDAQAREAEEAARAEAAKAEAAAAEAAAAAAALAAAEALKQQEEEEAAAAAAAAEAEAEAARKAQEAEEAAAQQRAEEEAAAAAAAAAQAAAAQADAAQTDAAAQAEAEAEAVRKAQEAEAAAAEAAAAEAARRAQEEAEAEAARRAQEEAEAEAARKAQEEAEAAAAAAEAAAAAAAEAAAAAAAEAAEPEAQPEDGKSEAGDAPVDDETKRAEEEAKRAQDEEERRKVEEHAEFLRLEQERLDRELAEAEEREAAANALAAAAMTESSSKTDDDEKDDEKDDSDDEPDDIETPRVTENEADLEEDTRDIRAPKVDERLSDEELRTAFGSLTRTSTSGQLNPMQFGAFIRMITGTHNLFEEMKLFHKFDIENDGAVSEQNFVDGYRILESQLGVDNWLGRGLRKLASGTSMVL